MAEVDTGTLILLVLALGAMVLLAGVFSDWRGLMESGKDLPFWSFLRRQGVRRDAIAAQIGERAIRQAEIRCAACGSRAACLARLESGADAPSADCPNAALFAARTANFETEPSRRVA